MAYRYPAAKHRKSSLHARYRGMLHLLCLMSLQQRSTPIAKMEVYTKLDEICGDKTAIYISHRLSSCKFCDSIIVFHEGQIAQQGTHEELVAEPNGKSHELWHTQAQYYTA